MVVMDTVERLRQLLSSQPLVPNFDAKLSSYGRRLKDHFMAEQLLAVTPETIALNVGQPSTALVAITGMKLQLLDGHEVDVEKDLLEGITPYSCPDGMPELKRWLWDLQICEHDPPRHLMTDDSQAKFDLCVTTGITEALDMCIKVIMEVEEDTILMEDINYINFLSSLKTQGMRIEGVDSDDKGMVTEALEDLLENWDVRQPGRRMPKLLYAVTAASNPMCKNWCLYRMLEIYKICRKYDILIMDDGAYHFVQFGQRPRSFQSFDVDGRVIRFDSFSKSIGAGYRIGWLSGPTAVVQKVIIYQDLACFHPCVLAQVVLYSMLKSWGKPGFERRVKKVSNFYKAQAQCVLNACNKYLAGLATWTIPRGGMFTWISFNPCVSGSGEDIARELNDIDQIQVSMGRFFQSNSNHGKGERSVRISFSSAPQEDLTKAIKCLGDLLARRSSQSNGKHGLDSTTTTP